MNELESTLKNRAQEKEPSYPQAIAAALEVLNRAEVEKGLFNALIVKEAGEELKIALKNRNFSFDCSDQSDALIRRMLEAFASNLNIPDLRVCNSERLGSEYSVLIDSVNGKFQLEFYYSQTLDTDGQVIGQL